MHLVMTCRDGESRRHTKVTVQNPRDVLLLSLSHHSPRRPSRPQDNHTLIMGKGAPSCPDFERMESHGVPVI